jgi:hypothetical protein
MKQIKFRINDELFALLVGEAARANQTPSAYAKQKIEYHLTGGNAQIDRLSSSIEQLTHRVYTSHNEMDLLCNKIIEVVSGMHDFLVSSDEKFSQRAIRVQQAINFCAAHSEIILKKDGGRDAVASMWKSLNKITGISQSQEKGEGEDRENLS